MRRDQRGAVPDFSWHHHAVALEFCRSVGVSRLPSGQVNQDPRSARCAYGEGSGMLCKGLCSRGIMTQKLVRSAPHLTLWLRAVTLPPLCERKLPKSWLSALWSAPLAGIGRRYNHWLG